MKKLKNPVLLLLVLISWKLIPQTGKLPASEQPFTKDRLYDTVCDRYGSKFLLRDLTLESPEPFKKITSASTTGGGKPIGGGGVVNVATQTCSAGRFDLYFAPGGFFDGNPQAQNTACMLFSNLSSFIASSLPAAVRINILCDKTTGTGAKGTASSVFLFPSAPSSANPGIADHAIWLAHITGANPFLNVPMNFANANSFFYGYINVNPAFNWHLNPTVPLPNSTFHDLYTLMLHEVLHAFGFASAIDNGGGSMFGPLNNYFSRFDKFLYAGSLANPLIKPLSASCPVDNYAFQGPNTRINPGSCTGSGSDFTNCGTAIRYISATSGLNVPVYTPNCWEAGSSLSHFEDMCYAPAAPLNCATNVVSPANNNLYFVMSNAIGSGNCMVRRHPRIEERKVLCDLGYACNAVYNSAAINPVTNVPTSYAYPGGACPAYNVWGKNDGFVSGNFTFIANCPSTSFVINKSTLLANDAPGATVACPQLVYTMGGVSLTNNPTNLTINAPSGAGLVVIKYLPQNGANYGNATYAFVFFPPCNCTPPNPCNMIQNAGFETVVSGPCSGPINFSFIGPGPNVSCWDNYSEYATLLTRACTAHQLPPASYGPFNLGINTMNSVPILNTYLPNTINGPNNRLVCMGFYNGSSLNEPNVLKNALGSPLLPSTTYQLSFMMRTLVGTAAPGTPPSGGGTWNPLSLAMPITIASAPNFAVTGTNYPSGLNVLLTQTFPVTANWQAVTLTFVYTGSGSHNTLLIGINRAMAVAGSPSGYEMAYMIDDVSLVPVNPLVSFTMPILSNCGSPMLNLGQYASVPGTFAGTGVTQVGSQYHFNAAGSLAAGVYPIAFSYTASNGCPITLFQTFTVVPPPGIMNITAPSTNFCANLGGNITLSAAVSPTPPAGSVYTWTPGGTGTSIIVSPAVTTNYVVGVAYPAAPYNGCIVSGNITINVANNCCPSNTVGMSILPASIVGNTTINSPGVLYGNMVINSGVTNFMNAEFLMAPNAQITVMPGAVIQLTGAHFYACGTDMWQGIDILDGGIILAGAAIAPANSSLIEDAMIAVRVSNITSAKANPPIEINDVIFNKNDIGIEISNSSLPDIDFFIQSCVFTSRDLPFTAVSWPNSRTVSPGLRYAAGTSTATSLSAPYLMNSYPVSNCKSPYNMRPARYGILVSKINDAPGAMPSGGAKIMYPPTYVPMYDRFNLFDNLGDGINVQDASLSTMNNVFQNAQQIQVTTGPGAPYWLNGQGILQKISGLMNAGLYLTPGPTPTQQNKDHGNRFWDLRGGILILNGYEFQLENAFFRSANQTSGMTSFATSMGGIYVNTNRFDYRIANNEFNNLKTAIRIGTNNGNHQVFMGPQTGVYAHNCDILQNYFGPEISSSTVLAPNTEYLDEAIKLEGFNTNTWFNGPGRMTIQSNKIDRAFRGISVFEMGGYPVDVTGNLVNLADDNYLSQRQYGIQAVKTLKNLAVLENTCTAVSTGNKLVSLIYFENNNGSTDPLVRCNDVSIAHTGFEFTGNNPGIIWMSNLMQGLHRGMSLMGAGSSIGVQGGPFTPIDNEWNGAWITPDVETYVDAGASPAPLYLNTFSPYWPTTNGSAMAGADYASTGNLQPVTGGSNRCVPVGYPPVPTNRSSVIVGIAKEAEENSWKVNVHPNPSDGNITIATSSENGMMTISVMDITGREVYAATLNGKTKYEVDLSSLKSSIYVLEIKTTQNETIRKKLIIE